MYDSVQTGRVGRECEIVYSMEDYEQNTKQCTLWKSRDIMVYSVQYGMVGIECKIVYSM